MRYRIVCVCLLVVLPVMNVAPAVPVPRPKPRKVHPVYALVYVGPGKNHKENAKRIARAISDIKWTIQPLADQEIQELAVVNKQKSESVAWFHAKIRIESLDGTAILRVRLMDGTPREQAIIINAVMDAYLKQQEKMWRRPFTQIVIRFRNDLRQAIAAGQKADQIEAALRKAEEDLASLPRLLERAAIIKD